MATGLGQNGYISNQTDDSFPGQEVGEVIDVADLIGIRADANSRKVWFKAFAGVTGGGHTQLEAYAICPRQIKAPGPDAFRDHARIALPTPLPSNLTGLKPGDKVYLSPTTPGAFTNTKPTTTGQLVQQVGIAFWEGSRLSGIAATEAANGVVIDIYPATVAP